MKIIVPIKQVPETSNVKMNTETGTVIRTGVETVVNPLDLYALENAIRIREKMGGTVTALSMGPGQAVRVLKEAVAMGCDEGILVSDRKFSGSDTWATSYTLAQAVKNIGSFDLIITGERATDGDTAQVGPGIASWLDIPLATYVAHILEIQHSHITVERLIEEGYQILSLPFPSLITVIKEIANPRLPTLKGKIRSKEIDIPVFNSDNMELETSYLGLQGSPTKVVSIHTPKITRNGVVLQAGTDETMGKGISALMAFLVEKNLL